uniref:Uncharacterized protein n=1 Tax=Arundo donax TaxID=35708 RepID=A0A0A9DRY2_ARUDO
MTCVPSKNHPTFFKHTVNVHVRKQYNLKFLGKLVGQLIVNY